MFIKDGIKDGIKEYEYNGKTYTAFNLGYGILNKKGTWTKPQIVNYLGDSDILLFYTQRKIDDILFMIRTAKGSNKSKFHWYLTQSWVGKNMVEHSKKEFMEIYYFHTKEEQRLKKLKMVK